MRYTYTSSSLHHYSTVLMDPYYYIQVKNIPTTEWLKYVDSPLAFYILGFFSVVFGDIFVGVKISSTIVVLLTSFIVYSMLSLGFTLYTVMGSNPYKTSSFLAKPIGEDSSRTITISDVVRMVYPLAVGVAGIITSYRLQGVRGRFLLSFILVGLNLSVPPLQYL